MHTVALLSNMYHAEGAGVWYWLLAFEEQNWKQKAIRV